MSILLYQKQASLLAIVYSDLTRDLGTRAWKEIRKKKIKRKTKTSWKKETKECYEWKNRQTTKGRKKETKLKLKEDMGNKTEGKRKKDRKQLEQVCTTTVKYLYKKKQWGNWEIAVVEEE